MIKFKSFSSGSCGNCYFIALVNDQGKAEFAFLIDAGVSMRRVKRELEQDGFSLADIKCVLITHDHFDHIRSLGSYCKYLRVPVYSTKMIHSALGRHVMTHEWMPGCRYTLPAGEWYELLEGRVRVRYFVVPHDATQTVGYAMELDGHSYVHITDCGRLTPEAVQYCAGAQTLVLESNYDTGMLESGNYPEDLKRRIRGGYGHLSNAECAAALSEVMHEGLRNVFLCHLSENNNTPELAFEASRKVVPQGTRLQTLPRQTPCAMVNL